MNSKYKLTIVFLVSYILGICLFFSCTYASAISRINCPYCTKAHIEILDESTGICRCTGCDGIFVVVNGKVKLSNGATLSLRDLYDLEALIKAIENGEFDHDYDDYDDYEYKGNNAREYLIDDDEGIESGYEEVDPSNNSSNSYYYDEPYYEDINSDNSSLKSFYEVNGRLYSTDFKTFEPETDEEGKAYLDKKYKRKKATTSNIATFSNIGSSNSVATSSNAQKKITDIVHAVRYYISIESDQYIPDVVYNGVEFKTHEVLDIEGFKFLGWRLTKDGKTLIPAKSPLTLYNFNDRSVPAARVYDFYAIWEKEETVGGSQK